VVDPEDRVGGEGARQQGVQLAGTGQVVTEGLLDDHPVPVILALDGHPMVPELADDLLEGLRRDRQVERVIAAGATFLIQVADRVGQPGEGLVVVELAADEADALQQLLPHLLAEGGAGMLGDGVMDDLGEVLILPVAPGETDQPEARRQQAAIGQVVDGRHQLLARQVTGHPEQHQDARSGDSGKTPVSMISQRIAGALPQATTGCLENAHASSFRSDVMAAGIQPCRTAAVTANRLVAAQ